MIFSKNLQLEEQVVFMTLLCLLPFIVQRTTIFENALYGFLFAPAVISRLLKSKQRPLFSSGDNQAVRIWKVA